MSDAQDGGPAFPGPFTGHCGDDDHLSPCSCYLDPGMSLRDYFALGALNGLLSAVSALRHKGPDPAGPHSLAGAAYELADAMLVARREKS